MADNTVFGNVPSDVSPALLPLASQQAVNVSVSGGSAGSRFSGEIIAYGGSSAPAGTVLCDGSTYDGTTATYANLWTAIGTTYGGTGQASFAVPDLRGRVIVGLGTNGSVNARGANDGVAVASRRPQHRHTAHSHVEHGASRGAGGGTEYTITTDLGPGSPGANTASADGGSGNASDSLDAPAYLVLNYIIAL